MKTRIAAAFIGLAMSGCSPADPNRSYEVQPAQSDGVAEPIERPHPFLFERLPYVPMDIKEADLEEFFPLLTEYVKSVGICDHIISGVFAEMKKEIRGSLRPTIWGSDDERSADRFRDSEGKQLALDMERTNRAEKKDSKIPAFACLNTLNRQKGELIEHINSLKRRE